MLNVMRLMQEMDFSIEDVDALTGQAVGWPKSATFRTIDLVGLDILGHVVSNMMQNVHDERSELKLPDFYKQMLERKWLGDKTKGGFYKKVKSVEGKEDERVAIDWKRWSIVRDRSRSSPRSTWQKTLKTLALACECCWAWTAVQERVTRRARSCGKPCPIVDLLRESRA